jgi:bifunctional non-homologous end joining protein LigD
MKKMHLSKTYGKVEAKNLDKVFWPKEGYTKGDLMEYYDSVAGYMLPYLKGRPQSLNRFPDGINGESFFQKNVGDTAPDWVQTVPIYSESKKGVTRYVVCNSKDTLLYMVNLGCIEINPWNSSIGSLDKPDYLVLDLDPVEIDLKRVIEVALACHKLLDKLGVPNYCKLTGGRGMHVLIPLGAKYDTDKVRDFAFLISETIHKQLPAITSLERMPDKRRGKVYLDYLQNTSQKTNAAVFSVRPRPGATVSMPFKWSELKLSVKPQDYTLRTVPSLLKRKGDPWKGFFKKKADMKKALALLEKNIAER